MELWCGRAAVIAIAALFMAEAFSRFDLVSHRTLKMANTISFALLILVFLAWAVTQLVEMVIAFKAGFRPLADAVDATLKWERELICELAKYPSIELRERAKHLELRVKRLHRRASIVGILTAISAIAVNVHDVGIKASLWVSFEVVKLFVYAASIGLLVGTLVVAVFSGRLEHIVGLLMLAADRRSK